MVKSEPKTKPLRLTFREQLYVSGAEAGLICNHPARRFRVYLVGFDGRRRRKRELCNETTAYAWAGYIRRHPEKGYSHVALKVEVANSPEVLADLQKLRLELDTEIRQRRSSARLRKEVTA